MNDMLYDLPCGAKKRIDKDSDTKKKNTSNKLTKLSTLEMRSYLKSKGYHNKYIAHMNREQLCQEMLMTPRALQKHQLLNYHNNSCYIDSSLLALFLCNYNWLQKNIFAVEPKTTLAATIQQELRNIYIQMFSRNISHHTNDSQSQEKKQSIRETCANLRSYFKAFDKEYSRTHLIEEIEWKHTQQEPKDVFEILQRIFDIPSDLKMSVKRTKQSCSQIHKQKGWFYAPNIYSYDIINKDQVNIASFFPTFNDDQTGMQTQYWPTSKNIICVNIIRNYNNEIKVKTSVKFPKSMTICGIKFNLVAAIIHNGNRCNSGHYTCMIKDRKHWLHYDDMDPSSLESPITSFSEWRNGYIYKNCTNLFYSKGISQTTIESKVIQKEKVEDKRQTRNHAKTKTKHVDSKKSTDSANSFSFFRL